MPEWGIGYAPSRRKDARYTFGQLIDTARAESVAVVKYGRAVVVVLALKEYERLKSLDAASPAKPK